MSTNTQIYVKAATRTRLRALAWLEDRTLMSMVDQLAQRSMLAYSAKQRREAYEAIGEQDAAAGE